MHRGTVFGTTVFACIFFPLYFSSYNFSVAMIFSFHHSNFSVISETTYRLLSVVAEFICPFNYALILFTNYYFLFQIVQLVNNISIVLNNTPTSVMFIYYRSERTAVVFIVTEVNPCFFFPV